MMLCKRCQDALYSRGERFKVIKYYGDDWMDHEPDEKVTCEWCYEKYDYYADEVDEIEFL